MFSVNVDLEMMILSMKFCYFAIIVLCFTF